MADEHIPLMNNATVNPVSAVPPGQAPPRIDAPELDESIVARPLVGDDFLNPKPKNPNVHLRWIEYKARDGYRFHQALSQGYSVATLQDLLEPAKLDIYKRENGTKFLNGDLILMKVDRKRYLGAIKYRVEQSLMLTDPGIRQAVMKRAAQGALDAKAQQKIQVFAPGAADLAEVGKHVNIPSIPGMAGTPGVEKGSGSDIRADKA